MTLERDAAALLDEARTEARRRGHDEVTVEHLVLAALASPATVVLLVKRAVDGRRLRAELEARVGALPANTAYRDASREPHLAPALRDLLATTARRRRLLFMQRPVRAIDLLLAAFVDPAIAPVIEESTFDVRPVERFAERAASIARDHGHVNVLVDHGVIAMIAEDERFREALKVLGHDPAAVRRKLSARLTRDLRSHRLSPFNQLVEFAATRTYLAPGAHEMTLAPIIVDLLRHPSVRTAVEAVDVNRYDLLYAYVHGRPPSSEVLFRSEGSVDVVVHDDAYTTMEFVVATLTRDFGLAEAEAKKAMLVVHEEGKAIVATMPRDRAMAGIIRAQGTARDLLMPLRIEVVQSVGDLSYASQRR